jgi:hypothetical protein
MSTVRAFLGGLAITAVAAGCGSSGSSATVGSSPTHKPQAHLSAKDVRARAVCRTAAEGANGVTFAKFPLAPDAGSGFGTSNVYTLLYGHYYFSFAIGSGASAHLTSCGRS